MSQIAPITVNVDELIAVNKYEVDEENAHIELAEARIWRVQETRAGVPGALYKINEDGTTSFDYAGCLECGTCRIACEGTIVRKWENPGPTMGVEYRSVEESSMRETYSTIRHLLHLATELDRACALFLSTHVSITHDEARVLLELGAAQQSLRPGALAKQLNLQPSTLSRVLRNLENRGFIERHRTTEDARSLSLSLTYLGARTAKETEQTLDRFFDGLGKHLGYDDLDGLLNAFQDATDYLSSCCPSCETPS